MMPAGFAGADAGPDNALSRARQMRDQDMLGPADPLLEMGAGLPERGERFFDRLDGGWVRGGCARLFGVHSVLLFCGPGLRVLAHRGGRFFMTPLLYHIGVSRARVFVLKYEKISGGFCVVEKRLTRLKEERKRSRLTQEELATLSGIARVTIARLETGTQRATPETMQKLARVLKAKPEDLV